MRRNGEIERGAAADAGLEPDAPVVALDDPLANCKPDPAARVLVAAVNAVEHVENLSEIRRVDPDAVIAHREYPCVAFQPGAHVDARRNYAAEPHGVPDQILK